jgi:hypothetical protein
VVTEMIAQQTIQVLSGASVALLYFCAIIGIGLSILTIGVPHRTRIMVRSKIGSGGFLWLGFIFGQGTLGMVWLILALSGHLYPWLVWVVVIIGWFLILPTIKRSLPLFFISLPKSWGRIMPFIPTRPWYTCMAVSIAIIVFLKGLMALLPTAVDDALWVYMTVGKVIGESHAVQFFAFATPHNALYPLQVEMHWAALFAISNETAVTLWDYLCAISFLCGIGYLSWCLTSSRRVALLAISIVLSTPGFYYLMGAGKADNAAAQYGIAAFLLIVVWPSINLSAIFLAALCAGWAIASRYTNIILLPALGIFVVAYVHREIGVASLWKHLIQQRRFWIRSLTIAAVAVILAMLPMLVKNWMLVDCPLAPLFGCEDTFWADMATRAQRQNLSLLDLFFYPFVWTFGARADMLGNISPLFIGLLPLFIAYRRPAVSGFSRLAGVAGLVSLLTWLSMHPFILFTRFLLVPLALLAIPLGASVLATEADLNRTKSPRRLFGIAMLTLFCFLVFQSRGVVHAIRYVSSIDTRANRFQSFPGYDVAVWLNAHAKSGHRIALAHWGGLPYFLESSHLLNSESRAERQWLWEHQRKVASSLWTEEIWRFYANQGFTYVVLAKNRVDEAMSAWPGTEVKGIAAIAYEGRNFAVIKIDDGFLAKREM